MPDVFLPCLNKNDDDDDDLYILPWRGGGGRYPHNCLYGEALPERGNFFRP